MASLNFRNYLRPFCFLVSVSAITLTVADAITETELEQKERVYRKEQAEIDLALARIQLDAQRGQISSGDAQLRIHEWLEANSDRLRLQAERGAELDAAAPVADAGGQPEPQLDPVLRRAPEAARFAELDRMERRARAEMEGRASGVELQTLVDEWATVGEGAAIIAEKRELWDSASRRAPTATLVSAQAPSESGDSAVEKAIHEAERQRASRIESILAGNPSATAAEIQTLIDGQKSELDAETQNIIKLHRADYGEKLAESVQLLNSKVGTADASPNSK